MWQTQPQIDFSSSRVKDFINHDSDQDNIYLFLRTNKNLDYTYLGQLMYVSHDKEKEKPVYFMWKIQNFDEHKVKVALPDLEIQY